MLTDLFISKSIKKELISRIETDKNHPGLVQPTMLYDYYGPFGHLTQEDGVIPDIKPKDLRARTKQGKTWLGRLINI